MSGLAKLVLDALPLRDAAFVLCVRGEPHLRGAYEGIIGGVVLARAQR